MSDPGGPISWEEYDRLMREHEERPAKLQAALAGAIAIAKEFDRRNEANKAQLTEALSILKETEWGWDGRCQFCRKDCTDGHGPDCRLAKVLGGGT